MTPPPSLADVVRNRLTNIAVDVMLDGVPRGPAEDIKIIMDRVHAALLPILAAAETLRADFELGPQDWGYGGLPPGKVVVEHFKAYDAAVKGLSK